MTAGQEDNADLPEGRHDAMVVDAEWVVSGNGEECLALALTPTAGALKGAVVEARFPAGSQALDAALNACGVSPPTEPGDPEVCAAVLAMPCTLVIAKDPERGTGLAVAPP